MTVEENKAIVRRMLDEGWNPNNPAVFDELLAEDFANHDPGAPDVRTREELKQSWAARAAGFPDQHVVADDLIGEGDQVVKRWTWRGTHTGEFMGLPPTGKQLTGNGLTVYRIQDGKIKELWWGYDNLGILQQLGVIPQPEQVPV